MTKFELPEKPKKTNTSEDFNNLRKAVDELDKFDYTWKTYANKADRRINAANKYIEELERENQRLIAENVAVKTLVDNAKPQQALPVVPECVAEFIENYDDINETSLLYIMKDFVESNHWDVFCEIPDNLKKYGRWDDMLYKAIRFGYTVAKEKRFYLKHKSVLIFDPDSDNSDVDELYLGPGGNFVPYQHLAKIFTQSQIDSMETGSYEQIKVEVEK
ncbi:DUF1642 domain-containing protein [Lactococcus petauri]|uniref:DUF1642 domain-containing protein n=1 Tax=Lactococcus petauri TaxID=1940789 RepID=UPI00254E868D|nr:DUF1642 domain-containing protein [Lactococcus petauri]